MTESSAITEDTLLGGGVTVFQPKHGFRAGTDSVLLGASVANLPLKGQEIADFGAGAGGALFPAMYHLPTGQFTAVEKDPIFTALLARGARVNKMSDRLSIIQSCARAFADDYENKFDLVVSNPPYFEAGKIAGPANNKNEAYIESVRLDDWLKAMLFAARPQAYIVLIHRAAELARLLSRLDRQAGEITVMPIRPYPGAEANRVLVSARKGLRTGRVRLLAGLDIFDSKGGTSTARARRVMSGEPLEWI